MHNEGHLRSWNAIAFEEELDDDLHKTLYLDVQLLSLGLSHRNHLIHYHYSTSYTHVREATPIERNKVAVNARWRIHVRMCVCVCVHNECACVRVCTHM
jgi:hypothetical protein